RSVTLMQIRKTFHRCTTGELHRNSPLGQRSPHAHYLQHRHTRLRHTRTIFGRLTACRVASCHKPSPRPAAPRRLPRTNVPSCENALQEVIHDLLVQNRVRSTKLLSLI